MYCKKTVTVVGMSIWATYVASKNILILKINPYPTNVENRVSSQ